MRLRRVDWDCACLLLLVQQMPLGNHLRKNLHDSPVGSGRADDALSGFYFFFSFACASGKLDRLRCVLEHMLIIVYILGFIGLLWSLENCRPFTARRTFRWSRQSIETLICTSCVHELCWRCVQVAMQHRPKPTISSRLGMPTFHRCSTYQLRFFDPSAELPSTVPVPCVRASDCQHCAARSRRRWRLLGRGTQFRTNLSSSKWPRRIGRPAYGSATGVCSGGCSNKVWYFVSYQQRSHECGLSICGILVFLTPWF